MSRDKTRLIIIRANRVISYSCIFIALFIVICPSPKKVQLPCIDTATLNRSQNNVEQIAKLLGVVVN